MADAIDKLTSFENFYLLVTVAEIITGKEIIPGTPNDIYKLIDWVREYLQSETGGPTIGGQPIPGVEDDSLTAQLISLFGALPTAFGGLID